MCSHVCPREESGECLSDSSPLPVRRSHAYQGVAVISSKALASASYPVQSQYKVHLNLEFICLSLPSCAALCFLYDAQVFRTLDLSSEWTIMSTTDNIYVCCVKYAKYKYKIYVKIMPHCLDTYIYGIVV